MYFKPTEGTFEQAKINASKYRSFEEFVEEIHEQESKIKKIVNAFLGRMFLYGAVIYIFITYI